MERVGMPAVLALAATFLSAACGHNSVARVAVAPSPIQVAPKTDEELFRGLHDHVVLASSSTRNERRLYELAGLLQRHSVAAFILGSRGFGLFVRREDEVRARTVLAPLLKTARYSTTITVPKTIGETTAKR